MPGVEAASLSRAAVGEATADMGRPRRSGAQASALDADGRRVLHAAAAHRRWSARSVHRVRRIARTIADLAGADRVAAAHVARAVQYGRALATTRGRARVYSAFDAARFASARSCPLRRAQSSSWSSPMRPTLKYADSGCAR